MAKQAIQTNMLGKTVRFSELVYENQYYRIVAPGDRGTIVSVFLDQTHEVCCTVKLNNGEIVPKVYASFIRMPNEHEESQEVSFAMPMDGAQHKFKVGETKVTWMDQRARTIGSPQSNVQRSGLVIDYRNSHGEYNLKVMLLDAVPSGAAFTVDLQDITSVSCR